MRMCSPENPNIVTPYRRGPISSIKVLALLAVFGAISFTSSGCTFWADQSKPKGTTQYQKISGDDSEDDRDRWDRMFDTVQYIYGKDPSQFLKDMHTVLGDGKGRRVLDIAMGEGRNAVYMAKLGFTVDGVDFSEKALQKARLLARENQVSLNLENADLAEYKIKQNTYDVILNINYLQRDLVPQIRKGLKKGGIVVFENYTVERLKIAKDEDLRRDWLLEKGELDRFFEGFRIIAKKYDPKEALESMIAQKL